MNADDRKRFAPAGQLAMPHTPAQLALDGTPMEPPADPPPWEELAAIVAAHAPSAAQLELPRAGELAGVERRPRPRKRSATERRRRRRESIALRARKRIKVRAARKRDTRRTRMERVVTAVVSLSRARERRVETALAELPRELRRRTRLAACGERISGDGEVTERVRLEHPRARKTVALMSGLYQAARSSSARPGWRMVTFSIARLAGLLGHHVNTLAGTLHRGDAERGDRWKHGDNGYLRALAECGAFAYHQPRRPGDGRAPVGVPVTERGPDESPGQPGYAFAQFWFPPGVLSHLSAEEQDERTREWDEAFKRGAASVVASRAPPPG